MVSDDGAAGGGDFGGSAGVGDDTVLCDEDVGSVGGDGNDYGVAGGGEGDEDLDDEGDDEDYGGVGGDAPFK